MKPLAIDLSQSKFLLRADMAIEELVACWAQNPDHVPPRIGNNFPCAITLKLWFMSYFKNAFLAAGFASGWDVRISAAHASEDAILEWSPRIVDFLNMRFFVVKCAALFTGRFAGAFRGAVSSIGIWRDNIEVIRAPQAISTDLRYVRLLSSPATSYAGLARCRAI